MCKLGTKHFLIILAVLMVVLSGCTISEASVTSTFEEPLHVVTPSPESITISFWEWRGGALAEFMGQEAILFQEQYPWITLEISQFPDRRTYREALTLAYESGDVPDVFIRPSSLSTLVDNEWVQPISPWITPEWQSKFPEGSFAETMNIWQGKVYSFPVFASGSPRMLFINEQMFHQAGLVNSKGELLTPKTWGDLRSMAAQITEAGNGEYYGIGISTKDSRSMSWWFDLAGLAGAPMTPYDFDFHTGEYVYGSHPGFSQIVELLLGMKDDGSVYPYESTLEDRNIYSYFAQGNFAIFMSGSYVVSNLRQDFPDFQEYRVIPLPIPDEGMAGDFALLPGTAVYYMSSRTKYPDAAWLWLDWLSSRETHKRMVVQASNFSVYGDLNSSEFITDEHQLQSYSAQSTYGVYGPFPPNCNPQTAFIAPETVVPDVGDVLIGIYTGQLGNWQQALADLDTRKQEALVMAIQEGQAEGFEVNIQDFIFPDWNPLVNYVVCPEE